VPNGQSTTANQPVTFGSADHNVQQATTGQLIAGYALQTVTGSALLPQCDVAMPGPVIPVIVGTGGATRGKFGIMASDNTGMTDQTMGGGTTVRYSNGFFTQSGVAGDMVGFCLSPTPSVSA